MTKNKIKRLKTIALFKANKKDIATSTANLILINTTIGDLSFLSIDGLCLGAIGGLALSVINTIGLRQETRIPNNKPNQPQ